MKRSPELAPLSRDHQHALAVALDLRRATPASLAAAVAGLMTYLEAEGERHFVLEEQHVLPALPADDPDWAPLVGQVLQEHAALRSGAQRLREAPALDAAQEVGEALHRHVRFEERVVFPMVEQRLPADALQRLGAHLEA